MNISKEVIVGKNHSIDDNVILGYLTGRKINNQKLTIGNNPVIRSGSVIYAGTTIGDDLQTGHNVIIREENIIGNKLWIWSNACIDYGCKIGNNVRIHVGTYICQFTQIGDNVFLAPNVSLANDKYPISIDNLIGPKINPNSIIGMNSTILPNIVIGENCIIGSGSVVTKDIPDGKVAFGVPAKIVGDASSLKNKQKHGNM